MHFGTSTLRQAQCSARSVHVILTTAFAYCLLPIAYFLLLTRLRRGKLPATHYLFPKT